MRASQHLPKDRIPVIEERHQALTQGIQAIKEIGGADVGDCTLLDALVPAITSLAHTETSTQVCLTQLTLTGRVREDASGGGEWGAGDGGTGGAAGTRRLSRRTQSRPHRPRS